MNKKHVLGLVVVAFGGLAFVFNNCSKITVSDLEPLPPTLSEASQGSETDKSDLPSPKGSEESIPTEIAAIAPSVPSPPVSEPEAEIPSAEDQASVIENLPPTITPTEPQPVTDLIEHPELFEVYSCPNTLEKVMICHYPQGTNPPNTQCVGKTAVTTHFAHTRAEMDADGTTHTKHDYLGPCR